MSLLFFLAAYLLGLITAFFIPNGQIWLTSVLLSILVMALLIFTKKNKFLNYSLSILSFTVGAANFNLNSTHLLPIAYQKGTIQLNLLEYTNKPNIFIAIPTNENWFTQSKILLDLSKDTLQSFKIGEDLFIEGIFMPLEERKNNSLVSIKCYAKKVTKQIKTTESESLAPSILQEKLSNRLNVLIKDSTESAFIKAMIWGDTHNLNFELKEQFKATGAYHLLAVSGMQISIIISCITGIGFLITFLFRKTKFFIALTLLFLVIYFALISGGSASVWRASVMGVLSILCGLFSVQLTKTDTFISTLFITLLVFPDFLFNWGFIFSIAAIFGIYFIHPILIKKIKTSSFFLAKCAEIISITLSTQLVLFPLIWYLFKSFPIYFLISNIILVPLTTILIFYILSLLIIHSIYEISPWMQEMAHHLTNKAIKINETIAQFPGAVLHLPSISLWQVFVLYAIIITLFFIRSNKSTKYIQSIIAVTMFICLVHKEENPISFAKLKSNYKEEFLEIVNYQNKSIKFVDTPSKTLPSQIIVNNRVIQIVSNNNDLLIPADVYFFSRNSARIFFDKDKLSALKNSEFILSAGISERKKEWIRYILTKNNCEIFLNHSSTTYL